MVNNIRPSTSGDDTRIPSEQQASKRAIVRERLQARRDFWSHAFVFVVFNTAVVLICAITASGYFWPVWLIGVWAVGLAIQAWNVFVRKTVTEDDVDEAMRKQDASRG